jgi:hypothetical protein
MWTGKNPLRAPDPYVINNVVRDWIYFLVDGIYPPWAIFVCPFQDPSNAVQKHFNDKQEAWRKDVERAFSILQEEQQILQRPMRQWYLEDLVNIVKCCVITHNMVVECRRMEREREGLCGPWWADPRLEERQPRIAAAARRGGARTLFGLTDDTVAGDVEAMWAERVASLNERMTDPHEHVDLRNDLVQHVWARGHHNTC